MAYGDDYSEASERSIPSQTRTHLPDDPGGSSRRDGASPRRSLVTVVGVVLVLIGAIAFANRADDGSDATAPPEEEAPAGEAAPTAPTGEQPVETTTGIPSGFPQTEQGAESAAANFAVALGGEGMFHTETRHDILDEVYDSATSDELKAVQDDAYSPEFLDRLGLDEEGNPPPGMTFVSRTVPVGTSITDYQETAATVEVWSTALIGMAGEGTQDPIRTDWKTWTFDLEWQDGDWQVVNDLQEDGPAPVPGDLRASTSDEIAEAVEGYGGFTYAR